MLFYLFLEDAVAENFFMLYFFYFYHKMDLNRTIQY